MGILWFMAGVVVGLLVAWFVLGAIFRKQAGVREAELAEDNRRNKQAVQSAREAHQDAIERLAKSRAKESTILERVESLEVDLTRTRKELVRVKASYAEASAKVGQLQQDRMPPKADCEPAEDERHQLGREPQKARVDRHRATKNRHSVIADLESRLLEREEKILHLETRLGSVRRGTPGTAAARPGDPAVKTLPRYAPPDPRRAQAGDLTRIKGIDPDVEKKLAGIGITSLQQIADLTPADIDRLSELLEFTGKIEGEKWVAQAKAITGR